MNVLRTAAIVLWLMPSLGAQAPSVDDATARAAGDTVVVLATINNPSMYDVYLMSGRTDAAATVEMIDGAKPAASLTVPAYGSLTLTADGPHVKLSGLKRPPQAGDKLTVTMETDGGIAVAITAVVQ